MGESENPKQDEKTLYKPHSEESERATAGSVLLNSDILSEVESLVHPDDFFHPATRAVYEACVELYRASKPIDYASVERWMREAGTFDRLRAFHGAEYLHELSYDAITPQTAPYHARIVAVKAERRRWLARLHETLISGHNENVLDGDFFAASERLITDLAMRNSQTRGPEPIKSILRTWTHDLQSRYEKAAAGGSAVTGIATGLRAFDEITSGFQRQDLVILGARPSMGKTSFALAACDGACKSGAAVLVFSCEMSAPSLVERLVASDGRIDGKRLQSGRLEVVHWVRLSGVTARLAEQPIWIDDDGSVTVDEIRSRARRWRAKHAANREALVIVDYVQLIESERVKGRNREQEVSAISRGLKALAKELDCPVLALAQLNRDLEKRPDKRPRMADLRDSGGIEQDADVIAFLYRDEVYNEETEDKGIAEVIVAKQRKGPTGVIRLAWLPEFCRFENLSERNSARGAA